MTAVVARRAALPVAVAVAVCPRLARARTPASTTRPPAPTAGDPPPCHSFPAKTARSIAVTASRRTAPPAQAGVATRAVAVLAAAAGDAGGPLGGGSDRRGGGPPSGAGRGRRVGRSRVRHTRP